MCSADPKVIVRAGSSFKNHVPEAHGNKNLQANNHFVERAKIKFKYNSAQEYASPRLSNVPSSSDLNSVSHLIQNPSTRPITKQSTPIAHKSKRSEHNAFKYYTTNESYELDEEIADDLEKILGPQLAL